MRVMLDTNILVSALFFPSVQTEKLLVELTENHEIILCDYVVEELSTAIDRKFPKRRAIMDRFLVELPYELVYTPKAINPQEFSSVRDRKDSPILATVIREGVDVFLSGDKDFLVLDIEALEILTKPEFIEKYCH